MPFNCRSFYAVDYYEFVKMLHGYYSLESDYLKIKTIALYAKYSYNITHEIYLFKTQSYGISFFIKLL